MNNEIEEPEWPEGAIALVQGPRAELHLIDTWLSTSLEPVFFDQAAPDHFLKCEPWEEGISLIQASLLKYWEKFPLDEKFKILWREFEEEREPIAEVDLSDGPIHFAFGLSYSNYLVVTRSVLQSMPHAWQQKLVDLMDEMNTLAHSHGIEEVEYRVEAVNSEGDLLQGDPIPDYDRGRTRLWVNEAPKVPDLGEMQKRLEGLSDQLEGAQPTTWQIRRQTHELVEIRGLEAINRRMAEGWEVCVPPALVVHEMKTASTVVHSSGGEAHAGTVSHVPEWVCLIWAPSDG